ncbi:DNA mismatch repair endonuclease MutL [Holdemania massiliensis]|uniref:DNA mismatch repair endonuclease MutL n=1 Tax=Holdemania massiliensis TaxID=1468449 RepID=UPI001F06BCBC|nr:DNA mismatch repair endonuclease MutL [Holdemania massiliensis]MCH1942603.1 DNA mismatch repair endonuclease MutL [Holdemania massiliensis]
MAKIQQLDAHLTNMIAAGEVVERPMGVIKELVENALDAQATRIEVNINQGGTELMEVIDNGIGMDREDACLCFERHATSKIKTTEDLWAIHTLGFRGEALPSIASVSNLTLLTNNGEDSTRVEIRYGQRQSARPYPCNQGTQITVSGLFQKTPARLKHLKSIPYETSLILDVIQKFALSYPNVAFRLVHDGKEVFRSAGNGSLLEVMAIIYGRDLARQCIEVDGQDFDYTVRGLMALPSQTRASRNYMTVFINRRMIRSYRIQKAILEAYKNYIPQDRYPIVVLDIEMDSHLCDVNVHPSKWEIRLSKEQQLEFLIRDTLTRTLREHMQAPEVMRIDTPREKVEMPQLFEVPAESVKDQVREDSVEAKEWRRQAEVMNEQRQREFIAASLSREISQPQPLMAGKDKEEILPEDLKGEVMAKLPDFSAGSPVKKNTASAAEALSDQEPVSEPLDPRVSQTEAAEETLQTVPRKAFPQMQVLAQMHGKYILAQDEHALYIIDQHAAQERVHFEEVQQRFLDQEPTMQDLLVPIILEGSASVAARLQEMNELLEPMHIHLENFGQNSLICRQLPAWMSEIDEQAFLQDVLDLWKDGREVRAEDLQRHRLATIACHHSIRFNRVLSLGEMQEVIEQLAHCEQPYHCPHGRPTFITITEKQLIKEFQR